MKCPHCNCKVLKHNFDIGSSICSLSCKKLEMIYGKTYQKYYLKINDSITITSSSYDLIGFKTNILKKKDYNINNNLYTDDEEYDLLIISESFDITDKSLDEINRFIELKMKLLILQ